MQNQNSFTSFLLKIIISLKLFIKKSVNQLI
jgi:hypothetical protein